MRAGTSSVRAGTSSVRAGVLPADASRAEAPRADEPRVGALLVERRGRRFVAEVKTGERAPDPLARPTRRQLLEYAHWPGAEPVDELVVASDRPLDADAAAWLAELRDRSGPAAGTPRT